MVAWRLRWIRLCEGNEDHLLGGSEDCVRDFGDIRPLARKTVTSLFEALSSQTASNLIALIYAVPKVRPLCVSTESPLAEEACQSGSLGLGIEVSLNIIVDDSPQRSRSRVSARISINQALTIPSSGGSSTAKTSCRSTKTGGDVGKPVK